MSPVRRLRVGGCVFLLLSVKNAVEPFFRVEKSFDWWRITEIVIFGVVGLILLVGKPVQQPPTD